LYLTPAIIAYKKRHPNLAFNLRVAPQMPDLLEGGFDLAIHAGGTRLDDSDLVARKIGSFQLTVCAAPSYLDDHGWPQHPTDLGRHNCLVFHNEMATDNWVFRNDESEIAVRIDGDFHANQGAALRLAAEHGLGVVRLPDYLVVEQIAAGRLIEILTEYESPPRAVYVIYPHRRLMPAKVRSFVDFLAHRFETGHGFEDERVANVAHA
jgi:DNA-binding transcriptional LysR family regulator